MRRVVILVFPGTNWVSDTARLLYKAGKAHPCAGYFKNRPPMWPEPADMRAGELNEA